MVVLIIDEDSGRRLGWYFGASRVNAGNSMRVTGSNTRAQDGITLIFCRDRPCCGPVPFRLISPHFVCFPCYSYSIAVAD